MTAPRRGTIAVCALPGDYGKPRPVLVMQHADVAAAGLRSMLVCPITSDLSGIPVFRVALEPAASTGLHTPSEIMVEKVTAVAAARLREPIGHVDDATMAAVERALLAVFGIGVQ